MRYFLKAVDEDMCGGVFWSALATAPAETSAQAKEAFIINYSSFH